MGTRRTTVVAILLVILILHVVPVFGQDAPQPMLQVWEIVEHSADGVEKYQLTPIQAVDTARSILAIATANGKIACLCLEGESSLLPYIYREQGKLSTLLIDRNALTVTKACRVDFYEMPPSKDALGSQCVFRAKHTDNAFYFYPPLTTTAVVQFNAIGSTCQPKTTVRKNVFSNDAAVEIIDNMTVIRMNNDIYDKVKLPPSEDFSYTVSKIENEYITIDKRQKIGGIDKEAINTGCTNIGIFIYDIKQKKVWEPKPLINSEATRYSAGILVTNGIVWWEYYPGTKAPNGIWVLRHKEVNGKEQIITAIRNVGTNYYTWVENQWQKSNTPDRSVMQVGLASNGTDVVVSILGRLFLLTVIVDIIRQ